VTVSGDRARWHRWTECRERIRTSGHRHLTERGTNYAGLGKAAGFFEVTGAPAAIGRMFVATGFPAPRKGAVQGSAQA